MLETGFTMNESTFSPWTRFAQRLIVDAPHLPFAWNNFDVANQSFMRGYQTNAEKLTVFRTVRRALRRGGHFGRLDRPRGLTHANPTASEWRAAINEAGFREISGAGLDSTCHLLPTRQPFQVVTSGKKRCWTRQPWKKFLRVSLFPRGW